MSTEEIMLLKDSLSIIDGRLIWKIARNYNAMPGMEAGTIKADNGYKVFQAYGVVYYAHRVVFAIVNERWPNGEIDHINGDRADNRPENLREASRSQNAINTGIRSNNKSGMRGVFRDKKTGKWRAQIRSGPINKGLGYYEDKEDAAFAYEQAAEFLHGAFRRTAS